MQLSFICIQLLCLTIIDLFQPLHNFNHLLVTLSAIWYGGFLGFFPFSAIHYWCHWILVPGVIWPHQSPIPDAPVLSPSNVFIMFFFHWHLLVTSFPQWVIVSYNDKLVRNWLFSFHTRLVLWIIWVAISPLSLMSHVVMNSFLGCVTLQYLKHPQVSISVIFGGAYIIFFFPFF